MQLTVEGYALQSSCTQWSLEILSSPYNSVIFVSDMDSRTESSKFVDDSKLSSVVKLHSKLMHDWYSPFLQKRKGVRNSYIIKWWEPHLDDVHPSYKVDRRSAHQSDPNESPRCWEDQSSHKSPTERPHSNDPKEIRSSRLALQLRTTSSSTKPQQCNNTEGEPVEPEGMKMINPRLGVI